MIDKSLLISTFALIFVAELPDKTAFATLLLATRESPLPIFVGVAGAFLVQCMVAVAFGSVLGALPHEWVQIGAGFLFLLFAFLMWKRKPEAEEESASESAIAKGFWKTVWTSFIIIFIAEWGDLTQLATASLVAKTREPLTIFIASVLALWSVTALAILIGNRAKNLINADLLQKIAAIAFTLVGIYFLITGIRPLLH